MSNDCGGAARRRRLVEVMLRERGLRPSEGVVAVPRNRQLRASLAQERMWFWDRVTWPRSFLHNVPLAARLRGPLDVAALRSAFERLVARQESLRTSFMLVGSVVSLRIEDRVDVPLDVVDLSSRPDPWAESEELCLEEARVLFDITRAPPLRAKLFRLAEDDHVLMVNAHHIVWDGWSTGLLVHEISTHYRRALGVSKPLPDLPVQYADWACWQHQHLSGDRLAYHTAFWQKELSGARTIHLTPAVSPPEGCVTDRGMTQPFSISPELTKALADLGRKEGATLFMVLLAGLSAVMHGLSGEDDVTIGGLIANRTTSQIDHLIGYFVNTVPIRSRLPHDRPFVEHLRHVRAVALVAFEHQTLPIGRIARSVADRRPQGWDEPLYSIDFMLQTVERPETDFGNVKVDIPDYNTRTADYDMGCIMWQREADLSKVDGLECWWEYKTELFDQRYIQGLIRRFVSTLELIAWAPQTSMLDLPVVEPAEQERAIVLGGPGAPSPEDVVDAIARNARERGSAAALRGPDGVPLAYETLNAAILAAVQRLAAGGVSPGGAVTCYGLSQQSALVAACAALHLGAAFCLVEDKYALEAAAAGLEVERVFDATGSDLGVGSSSATLGAGAPQPSPADPAQVVLDADSARRKVAVVVPRRSLGLAVDNVRNALRLDHGDTVLQHAPPLRDAQAWLILAPLSAGAELRLFAEDASDEPAALADILCSGSISIVHTTSAGLPTLLDACKLRPPKLRAVVVTEDSIPPELIHRWGEKLPGVDLFSTYTPPGGAGPVMLHRVEASTFVTAGWEALGLPQPANAAYLLDSRGKPIAPGAVGNLFVGGDAIAGGYLGEPRLTAERFVPDPFSQRRGARMFATGARARRRHDGLIERMDVPPSTVRLDGRFVRPEEVDAALIQHPMVRRSLTLPIRSADRRWRLVSYVMPADEPLPSAEAMLARYWRELPDMAEMPLETLPAAWDARAEDRVLVVRSGASSVGSPATGQVAFVTDLNDHPCDDYDLVVLNSVTHRLPSRAHLERVLAQAVERVRAGGRVLVTGLRHLGLRRAFHCARRLAASDPDALFSSVRQQVCRSLHNDPELAVDPSFSCRAARELPRVSGVLVQPHQGAADDAEVPFLFDLVLHIAHSDVRRPTHVAEVAWPHDSDLSRLTGLLVENVPGLVVRGIPDPRVLYALGAERAFDETLPGALVRDLRRATPPHRDGIHPDAVASFARRHGYEVAMALEPRSPGKFAAALSRQTVDARALMMGILAAESRDEPTSDPPCSAPTAVAHRWAVVRHVREWLRGCVPPTLHPSLIIAVDEITTLADGHPNTFALPTPGHAAKCRPFRSLDRALAEAWGDTTGFLSVGAHERFVEDLGAHPVLAAELVARLGQSGYPGLCAQDVLRAQTMAEVAAFIQRRDNGGEHVAQRARQTAKD